VSGSLIGGGAPVVDNFSSYPHTVMLGSYISHVVRSTATTIEPISSRIVISSGGLYRHCSYKNRRVAHQREPRLPYELMSASTAGHRLHSASARSSENARHRLYFFVVRVSHGALYPQLRMSELCKIAQGQS
jgi:hypothetical protein